MILLLAIGIQYQLVTDKQMDRQTDRRTRDDHIYRASTAFRGKNDFDKYIENCIAVIKNALTINLNGYLR